MDNFTPEKAKDTTQEHPWPVAWAVSKFSEAVKKWPFLWVEGQIAQIDGKRSAVYITLKDLQQNISMPVTAFSGAAEKCRKENLSQGDKIVVYGQPNLWVAQCKFSLQACEIEKSGEGPLVKIIEALKQKFAEEGLFDLSRKVPIPSFPRKIGLVCGAGARAEGDIVTNSLLRWPDLDFYIEHAAVQGKNCPSEVSSAIKKLDEMNLDVIIVARGGGSYEDLVGFSNEQVVRAAADCKTPIVSAIGHEGDWTLLDLVADRRCSTPTDVAKTIIPDFAQEEERVKNARSLLTSVMGRIVAMEEGRLFRLASAPFIQDPYRLIERPERALKDAEKDMNIALSMKLDEEMSKVFAIRASLKSLSPFSTLSRGYALVEKGGGILSGVKNLKEGDEVKIVMQDGELKLKVEKIEVRK